MVHNMFDCRKNKQKECQIPQSRLLHSVPKIYQNYLLPLTELKCPKCNETLTTAIDLSETPAVKAIKSPLENNCGNIQCANPNCNYIMCSNEPFLLAIKRNLPSKQYDFIMNNSDRFIKAYEPPSNLNHMTLTDQAKYSLFQFLNLSHDTKHRFTCFTLKHFIGCRYNMPHTAVSQTTVTLNENNFLDVDIRRDLHCEWLANYHPVLLKELRCNHNVKIIGRSGGSIETAAYSTNYTSKTQEQELLGKHLVLAGFQKRIDKETDLSTTSAAKIGRSRTFSLMMNITNIQQTGAPLASYYLLYSQPVTWESYHSLTTIYLDQVEHYLNNEPISGTIINFGNSIITNPLILLYEARPNELEQFCLYSFESLFELCKLSEYTEQYMNKKILLKDHFKYDTIGWYVLSTEFQQLLDTFEVPTVMQLQTHHLLYPTHGIKVRSFASMVKLVGTKFPNADSMEKKDQERYTILSQGLLEHWRKNQDETFTFSNKTTKLKEQILSNRQEYYNCKIYSHIEREVRKTDQAKLLTFLTNLSDQTSEEHIEQSSLDIIEEEKDLLLTFEDQTSEESGMSKYSTLIQNALTMKNIKLINDCCHYQHTQPTQIIQSSTANTSNWLQLIDHQKQQTAMSNRVQRPSLRTFTEVLNGSYDYKAATNTYPNPTEFCTEHKFTAEQTDFFMFIVTTLFTKIKKQEEEPTKIDSTSMNDDIQAKIIYLGGKAGTGKSYVLLRLKEFIKQWQIPDAIAFTATLGIAAVNLGGSTYYKFLNIRPHQKTRKKAQVLQEVDAMYALLHILIIDECSLLGASDLLVINDTLKHLKQNNKVFGDTIILLTGDFNQNLAIGKKSLISPLSSSTEKRFVGGKLLWQEYLTHVFFFDKVIRQNADTHYLTALNNMVSCTVTQQDMTYIASHTAITQYHPLPNPLQRPYVPFITRTHLQRYRINQQMFTAVQNQSNIYLLRAEFKETGHTSKVTDHEKQSLYSLHEHITDSLPSLLLLFVGLPIILTKNTLYIKSKSYSFNDIGIANGTRGIVKEILYDTNVTFTNEQVEIYGKKFNVQVPSELPTCIIIQLIDANQIKLRSTIDLPGIPNDCFPIYATEQKLQIIMPERHYTRKMIQFPMIPGIAITNHKFEGNNATDGIILLNDGGKTWMYTATTRAPTASKVWSSLDWDDKMMTKLNQPNKNLKVEMDRLHLIHTETLAEIRSNNIR